MAVPWSLFSNGQDPESGAAQAYLNSSSYRQKLEKRKQAKIEGRAEEAEVAEQVVPPVEATQAKPTSETKFPQSDSKRVRKVVYPHRQVAEPIATLASTRTRRTVDYSKQFNMVRCCPHPRMNSAHIQ